MLKRSQKDNLTMRRHGPHILQRGTEKVLEHINLNIFICMYVCIYVDYYV